jgi:hypothetical protein
MVGAVVIGRKTITRFPNKWIKWLNSDGKTRYLVFSGDDYFAV